MNARRYKASVLFELDVAIAQHSQPHVSMHQLR